MKKSFIAMGLVVASTLFFSNCKKVEVVSNETSLSKGTPFEIVANTESTKTTNDGLNTKWAKGDKITVFHAENGTTTYGSNDEFTVTGAGATSFSGTLQDGDLDNTKSYDWYAIYPYNKNYSTPANTTWYQQIANKITQNGYGSTAHLAGNKFPLVGQKKNVKAGTTPDISMKQICAVVKVVVTNNSGEALKISSASITSEKVNLAGGYYINFAGDEPVIVDENVEDHEKDKYMFKTVELTVENGTAIANGSTATLYFGVKPFTAQNETLKIAVNGYEKSCAIGAEAIDFKSGHIKTVTFNFDKTTVKLAAGNYAILAKRSTGNYWYMTNDLGTDPSKPRFTAEDSGLSTLPEAVTVLSGKLWTVSESDNNYTISTQEGKQISWTSGNYATLADEGKVFTVTSSTGGSFNVSFAATETETRTLALNGSTGNDYFAFYTGTGAKDLFFVPATLNTTPTLTLNKTSITDVAAAGVTGAQESGVYTLENAVDSDVEVSFDGTVVTAASISGGVLTYTVADNSGVARDGWVELKLGEQEAKTITVSQKGANEKTWTYTVIKDVSPAFTANTPITVNSATWSILMGEKVGDPTSNGSVTTYSSVPGWKWGDSSSKYWKSYTLSTDYFTSKKVKSVTVTFLNNGKKTGTMVVKQGNTQIGTDSAEFGTTWTDLTANTTPGTSGTLTIQYSVAQASYISTITVVYED